MRRLTRFWVGTGANVGIWSCVEVSLGVVSCNIPATTPLFIAVGEKLFGWKSDKNASGKDVLLRRRRIYNAK